MIATPVGYAAIIEAYDLKVPLPSELSALGMTGGYRVRDGWRIFPNTQRVNPSLEGHLAFALRKEGVDLIVLKRLFQMVGPAEIEAMVRAKPAGIYTRRFWFFYEWLLGQRLDLPDAKAANYVNAVDINIQFGCLKAPGGRIEPYERRCRVIDNLPGTPDFCPLVFATSKLEALIDEDWPGKAREAIGKVSKDLIARTAAFLLLKDSKSSYVIEGEQPPASRIQLWGKAIGEAGRTPLDEEELLRLQRLVIGDQRFVRMGFRYEGGFVGERDRDNGSPLPEHISAKPEDLPSLIKGVIEFDRRSEKTRGNPVIDAAALAFGFVYIHPFDDGNGRIHRYLIHHVLARGGFNPAGVHFPISSAILDRIDEYRQVLEGYSAKILPLIKWQATTDNNVKVLNDTADFYRFFDATSHAEFLYRCMRQTIEKDLPDEIRYLQNHDAFRTGVQRIVDMPERTFDNLVGFLRQNGGHLSQRALSNEFAALKADEVAEIERLYRDAFGVEEAGKAVRSKPPMQ